MSNKRRLRNRVGGRGSNIRDLSYDHNSARPLGQTEAEIIADAAVERISPTTHVPRPDRYWLLKHLGLAS